MGVQCYGAASCSLLDVIAWRAVVSTHCAVHASYFHFQLLCTRRHSILPMCAGYLAHGTATDYMYERLGVPLSFTWEIYGDTKAHFNDCFRMFNPVTQAQFDEARSL